MSRKSYDEKIAPHRALFGQETDAEIARRAGVAESTVVAYRRKLGVSLRARSTDAARRAPKRDPNSPRQVPFRPRPSRLAAFEHLLGVKSDAEVGALCRMSPANVRTYRKRRGIAAPGPTVPDAPTPETVPAPRHPEAGTPPVATRPAVWTVDLPGGTHAVVADDIALAARDAVDRAAGREITAIRWVAALI